MYTDATPSKSTCRDKYMYDNEVEAFRWKKLKNFSLCK